MIRIPKHLFSLVAAAALPLCATAQETTVKYYDRYGMITNSKQTMSSFKVFTPSEDAALTTVKETNIYTKTYNTGTVSTSDSLNEGIFSYYNAAKELIKTITYTNGQRTGKATEYEQGKKVAEYSYTDQFIQEPVTEYYPSGNIKATKQYLTGTDKILSVLNTDTAAYNYLVHNNTGQPVPAAARLQNIEGILDGKSVFYYEGGQVASEEEYKAGRLVKAVFFDPQGKQVKIEKNVWNLEQVPTYRGNYVDYISNNLLYPKKALEDGTGGTVVVSFHVSATGQVSDMKVIKSVSPEMDAEAMRVLKKTEKKWNPARYHNIPVAQYYIAPIIYNLSVNNNSMLR